MENKTITLTEKKLAEVCAEATAKVMKKLGNRDADTFMLLTVVGYTLSHEMHDILFCEDKSDEENNKKESEE